MPERLRGEVARFDINDKAGKTLVAKDKRITVKHIRDMETAGIKKITAPDEFILGRTLAHNVINKDTGEIIANANDEITETLLAQLREAKVEQDPDALHQRPRPGRRTSRRRCAPTRPPT